MAFDYDRASALKESMTGRNIDVSAASAGRAPSAVEEAQMGLDQCVGRLHAILNELESRLHPVLGPSKPTGIPNEKQGEPTTVASRIRFSGALVAGAVARVEDVLNRLEV